MKIMVCIKQVPEHFENLTINTQGTGIHLPENMKYRINRFDAHAIESAIMIKEQIPETSIDVVTIGPLFSESIVKRAMGMGADNGIIIKIESGIYLSPTAVSALLAKVASQKTYNLILTGIMSEDEMNAQTGQMLAARLNIPSISGVVDISIVNHEIHLVREREGGIREHIEMNMRETMTILLTIQAGINQPRYPSLSALLKANAKNITIIETDDLIADNDQSIISINKAEKMRQGRFIEGSIDEKASQFIEIMKERNVLL